MESQELVNKFLTNCRERGLAPSTLRSYQSHLKHFILAFPDGLPWEWPKIERFLTRVIKKKSARVDFKKTFQALYAFLERENLGTSPIPRGKVGRPPKVKAPSGGLFNDKLVRGGSDSTIRVELHLYIHEPGH